MKLINIGKIYHNKNGSVQALRDINLTINHVGLTFIVGSSGCGKTTLLNIITKKDSDYTGVLEIDERIEWIEQNIVLFDNMTVKHNLSIVSSDNKKIKELLNMFDMDDTINKKVKKLSIGQQKRVQIIRSLLVDFDCLICDEPTTALDYENIEIVMKILADIAIKRSVIIITHDIALVDKYANRIIRIDNGQIIDDCLKENQNKMTAKNKEINKLSLIKYLQLVMNYSVGRIGEFGIKTMLYFLMIILVFIGSSLFNSLSVSIKNMNMWRNSSNIIITQPISNKTKQDGNNNLSSLLYSDYDLYNRGSIELIRDNVDGVIGYQCGWNNSLYSPDAYTPLMTYSDLKEAVEDGQRFYDETGEIPYLQFEEFKSKISWIEGHYQGREIPEDQIFAGDFRNYDAFEKQNNNFPERNNYILGDYLTDVSIYQLFDFNFELKIGKIPEESNEIIINNDVAQDLLVNYQLESLDNLIGKKFALSIDDKYFYVKISGITYYENVYENQIFFKDGCFDQMIIDAYKMNAEKINYQYVYFISDVKQDNDKIVSNINQVMDNRKSNFVSYLDSDFVQGADDYNNPNIFYVFVVVALIVIVVFDLIMFEVTKKRLYKEWGILNKYHYQPVCYLLLSLLTKITLCAVVQIVLFEFVCRQINMVANSFGFCSFVESKISAYFLAFALSLVVLTIVEEGYYVFKNKRS